jgi:biopolymer transport protein TolQ
MVFPEGVNFFAEAGILYSFEKSSGIGKVIISLLMVGSMFSWSVMITKFLLLRRARAETAAFLKKFRASRKPLGIYESRTRFPGSPAYAVYIAGCKEMSYHLLGSDEIDETFNARLAESRKLPPVLMSSVKSAMERTVGEQALLLEDRMILLATAVSGGPFLGLLGTVWGVMDTFSGIAIAGKANLAVMAPGVASSLITTVMGLLVAIPAMFGYNYLVVSVRSMTVELDNFAAELAAAFEHRHLDAGS